MLSVSSVGSEAMQRGNKAMARWTWGGFQYPRSDRRRCNFFVGGLVIGLAASFSILGRIGGDATNWPRKYRLSGADTFSILGRIGGDATNRHLP